MKGEETLVVVGEILEEEGGTMGVVEEGTTEAVGEVTMGQWIMGVEARQEGVTTGSKTTDIMTLVDMQTIIIIKTLVDMQTIIIIKTLVDMQTIIIIKTLVDMKSITMGLSTKPTSITMTMGSTIVDTTATQVALKK